MNAFRPSTINAHGYAWVSSVAGLYGGGASSCPDGCDAPAGEATTLNGDDEGTGANPEYSLYMGGGGMAGGLS